MDFPTKNKKRALRRHSSNRTKQKAYSIARNAWNCDEEAALKCKKLADHLAFCTCMMCANPRSTLKQKTLKEKQADGVFREQFDGKD